MTNKKNVIQSIANVPILYHLYTFIKIERKAIIPIRHDSFGMTVSALSAHTVELHWFPYNSMPKHHSQVIYINLFIPIACCRHCRCRSCRVFTFVVNLPQQNATQQLQLFNPTIVQCTYTQQVHCQHTTNVLEQHFAIYEPLLLKDQRLQKNNRRRIHFVTHGGSHVLGI